MLEIQIKLSTTFHPQTDGQIEYMSQKLKYSSLWIINKKNQSEWLVFIEFTVNNKVYSATKVSSFIANYGWKLRIGVDIRRKGKVKKTIEFTERINHIYKEAKVVLKQVQEEIKKQTDRRRKKVELWKKKDKVILNMKDLVFKE